MQEKIRKHKLKLDYGQKDYYKYYKKNYKNTVDRGKYNEVQKTLFDKVINAMLNDNFEYPMTHLGFILTIRKEKRSPRLKDGKLYNNRPIDFKATNELWEKHPETKEKGLIVRHLNNHTSGYVFRIYLKKFKSNIKGRSYFKFRPMRKFKRDLNKRIKNPNKEPFDCFLLYTKIK